MDWKSARSLVLPLLLATATPPNLLADGHSAPAAGDKMAKMLRDASLALLKEGNNRFATGRPQHPNQEPDRRLDLAQNGENPLATILTCSDSRAPVELVFDRGVGDLFVVRVAGNVAAVGELASIEYGVGHLHTPLLIVLGHTRCGTVTDVAQGAQLRGHLPALAEQIQPAVAHARQSGGGDLINAAIKANVLLAIDKILNECPEVKERADSGQLSVLGAVYHLEAGTVEWLGARSTTPAAPVAIGHSAPPPAAPAPHLLAESGPAAPASAAGHSAHGHGDGAVVRATPTPHGTGAAPGTKPPRFVQTADDALMVNPPIAGTAPFGTGLGKSKAPAKGH